MGYIGSKDEDIISSSSSSFPFQKNFNEFFIKVQVKDSNNLVPIKDASYNSVKAYYNADLFDSSGGIIASKEAVVSSPLDLASSFTTVADDSSMTLSLNNQ